MWLWITGTITVLLIFDIYLRLSAHKKYDLYLMKLILAMNEDVRLLLERNAELEADKKSDDR
jgi:hypothetical protein